MLDRTNAEVDLSVHLLRPDEARLVALYRSLPPALREEGRARVEQAVTALVEADAETHPPNVTE